METSKITYGLIDQYLQGKLDEKAMHQLEKSALDDPFLADALEGYSETKLPAASQLSILQRQLEERIALQQEKKNVFHFTWQRISVAAAASLLFISASILFWMKGSRHENQTAVHEKQVDVVLSDPGSLRNAGRISLKETHPEAGASDEKSRVSNQSAANSESTSVPAAGWDNFNNYIEKNARLPKGSKAEGEVILHFNIDPSGTPVNIKTVKGLTETLNTLAVKLVKEGPKWKAAAANEVQVRIAFKKY